MALTCPFILQAIIYQAVVQAFQNAGPGAELDISVQSKNESTWRILFDGFSLKDVEVFPDDRIKRMAASIGVSIHWDHVRIAWRSMFRSPWKAFRRSRDHWKCRRGETGCRNRA
jgi:hypothetical protein